MCIVLHFVFHNCTCVFSKMASSIGSLYSKDLFKDEVVIITGGGSGIGKLMSEYFGNLGAKVAICGRREELLKSNVGK